MKKIYALLSAQGTACLETVLTEQEFNDPQMRERVEAAARADKLSDPPIPGSWTDVSDNEACRRGALR
jgi:hypothetical protein